MLHGNLSLALSVSLLAHAVVLTLPAGRLDEWMVAGMQRQRVPAGQPAGLHVSLAPYSIRPPSSALTERQRMFPRPPASAVIDSQGRSAGGLPPRQGDEGMAAQDMSETRGLPAPRYYLPDEVHERAKVVVDIDPYLDSMRDLPGSGSATLSLWINEFGEVDQVRVVTSDLEASFEEALADQFRAARFKPALREGGAVKSLMKIEVRILPRQRLTRSAASGR